MTVAELLSCLQRHNIRLRANNGQLILNGPKGALTAALHAELTEHKEDILTFLRNSTISAKPEDSLLRQVYRGKRLPLSFSQQRLWFLDQYEPSSSVYNIATAHRLRGALDVDALERSLSEIVRRHEALRTRFSVEGEEPVQVISPAGRFSLSVVDLGQFSDDEREREAQRLATAEAQRPFDLSEGQLFRASLLRLGEEDYILLCTMHHIVSDGWSMGVLYRELSVLYQAFTQRKPPPLPDLAIQYSDYAVWQREWLKGEKLEGQLSYWKKQLEGASAVLNLPTDRPRPALQSYRGKRQSIELSKELTQGLKALTRKEGVTLFMTLLAALQTLLYRYTGQKDIVVGSPISGRNQLELEDMIGFFVNTLVLRTDFSGDPAFRELLHRVRTTALGAYEHQYLPLEKLVEELRPERSLSHSPLFQVTFVFQNVPYRHRELSGLTLNPVQVDNNTTKFDLSLSLTEQAGGINGFLEYSTDLFDEATIIRMSGHFQTLLEGIVTEPTHSLSNLPILTEFETRQLLVEWNDTAREYPRDKCVHQLFDEQVAKTPDAVAVVFDDKELTYRELNERANQLAHRLKKLGVGAETLVGLCVERSLEMIVGVLGILKAGGAYVPLDPYHPKERLALMLEDTQAPVLLSQERIIENLPTHHAKVLFLDTDWGQIAKESNENPDSGATAKNLAYVIYTSGSTGRPKGVMIEHRGLVNYLTWCKQAYPLDSGQGSPVHSSLAFDLTVTSLLAPLITGRCAHLVPEAPASEGLSDTLKRTKDFSLVKITPAHLQLLSQQTSPQEAKGSTRAFVIGGEELRAEHVAFWQEHAPRTELVNEYGPTEAVVGCCVYRVPGDKLLGRTIPIGRPIINTQLYILDACRQPVPVGVPGGLYIGGDGLARGYLNRPELTAEKFIANPFSEKPGTKLYATGDLARYLPDSNIEFLGRVDRQVKLRGFRIELGEFETVLNQHPVVQESVVMVREESPANERLVAYVVSHQDQVCTASALRSFLKAKLPEYMVPSVFVFLDALPLTPNGKVDRKELPLPDQNRPELEQGFVAPRTPVEEIIAEIWAVVLKAEKVGVHDNFFELGGHSLLATQVVSRIREALRAMDLPVRALFEAPTVADLASRIAQSVLATDELEELAGNLAEVELLTDDEARRRLAEENTEAKQ